MRTAIRRAVLPLLLVTLVLALGSLAARAEPPDPYFDTHLGPVPERPVPVAPGQPGGEGGILDWSDIDWAPWVDGLTSHPWVATLAALAVLGISLARRNGWVKAAWETVGGLFGLSWNAMRQSQAGWIVTEILRRTFVPWVGAGIWAVKQVAGLPGAVKDLCFWLGQTTGENIRAVVSFVRADSQGRAQIVADQMERARSAWETVKAFPGLLWNDITSRWSRGWNGLVRMWTDRDVSNEELLQWGADHASMVADASVVVSAGEPVAVRANSWVTKVKTVRRVERLPVVSVVTGSGTQASEGALTLEQRLVISQRLAKLPGVAETIPRSVWAKALPQDALKTIRLEVTPGRLDYLPGFLADAADCFRPGYRVFKGSLQEDMYLLQFHADIPLGDRSLKWWTSTGQAKWLLNEQDVREGLALLNEWGARNAVSLARIPKGTRVTFLIGDAAEQSSLKVMEVRSGGGLQLRFLDFDKKWIIKEWP